MDAFFGTWVCDKSVSDPLSPFLEALGVGWISRKAMDAGGVTWVVSPSAGGYSHAVTNVGGTKTNTYVLGTPTAVNGADGQAYSVTSTLGADGTLSVAAVGVRARALASRALARTSAARLPFRASPRLAPPRCWLPPARRPRRILTVCGGSTAAAWSSRRPSTPSPSSAATTRRRELSVFQLAPSSIFML